MKVSDFKVSGFQRSTVSEFIGLQAQLDNFETFFLPMALGSHTRSGSRHEERGYALMILLLSMALLIIFAAAIVPSLKFQIERDREEELIHRGTQYSRAIRGYYKKFGRYPVKIEDLESTNNLRFLRKRYKDPTNCKGGTCQDFRLLHFGEVQLSMAMMGGGITNLVGSPGAVTPFGANPQNNAAIAGQIAAAAGSAGIGANPNPSFATNPAAGQTTGTDSSSGGGTDSNSSGSDNNGGNSGGGTTGSTGGPGSGQVFGGGPIVGVLSLNKKETIREFNHKKKYNEWQFIYDPGTDRGGLLMTPNQPPLQPLQPPGTQNGNGQNGGTTTPGLQNNQNQPANGQPTTPSDPNSPPQQQ